MKNRTTMVVNIMTIATLVATVCLLCFYGSVGFNIFNPFPYPTSDSLAVLPTATETPFPTWTPRAPSTDTPPAGPTGTRPPTLTPSATPTFPPTSTPTASPSPTPRVTRNPDFPFTCEVDLRRPEYGQWTGVAGHVQDLDGNPLQGYIVSTTGPVPGLPTLQAGADPRINTIYGSDAAWEQAYNPVSYQAMEVTVQLFNSYAEPDGSYRAVSDVLVVQLGGYASGSLGYVTCTLNWEEWETSDSE